MGAPSGWLQRDSPHRLLEVAGLYLLRTGRDLFGGVFSGAQEVKGGVIAGRKFPYRMNVPGAS